MTANKNTPAPHIEAPAEWIEQVLTQYPGRLCLTCSFQVEDMVVLHQLRQVQPEVPVLFLDTGYHFPETYAYRDRMAREWSLNLINLAPAPGAVPELYRTAPDLCCKQRKVAPLVAALEDYDVWFTGLRREQSPTRAALEETEQHRLPTGKQLVKVSLLAHWKWKDVWSYIAVHEIPHLPLYDQGYPSIGCQPCTSLPTDAANARSGRWGGVKLECGIHTFDKEDA